MKKFMKGAAITGGIFFLIGLVVMLIGIGGGGIKDMREKSMAELERVMEKFENIEGLQEGDSLKIGKMEGQ